MACKAKVAIGISRGQLRLWGEIAALYRERKSPTQFSSLGLSSFCDPDRPAADYPKLKGRAAEVKSLTPIIRDIWQRRQRADVQADAWVGGCFEALCKMQAILDESPEALFLEPIRARAFRRALDDYLLAALLQARRGRRRVKRPALPKFHQL